MKKYVTYYKLKSFNYNGGAKEHTIEEFLENIDKEGDIELFATNILRNRQRTSSKNGILKAQACKEMAEVLKNNDINTIKDFNAKKTRRLLMIKY